MPSYNIRSRVTNEYRYRIQANSPEEACEQVGWLRGDCQVEELVPPKNGQPPFVPTEDERENIQYAIDCGLENMTRLEQDALRDTLRRWMKAQNWES